MDFCLQWARLTIFICLGGGEGGWGRRAGEHWSFKWTAYFRGFIRSQLPAVNRRLCCLSPPVTKPHIQDSSSCNIKYRNGQKQLWVFVLHTLICSYTAAYLPMAVYKKKLWNPWLTYCCVIPGVRGAIRCEVNRHLRGRLRLAEPKTALLHHFLLFPWFLGHKRRGNRLIWRLPTIGRFLGMQTQVTLNFHNCFWDVKMFLGV